MTTTEQPSTEPETPIGATHGAEEPTDAPEGDENAQEPSTAGREAARYRRQLRESQSHAEALGARVEAMQRTDVERLAATDLQTPADLWLTGPDLADLLDEAGDVDPEKVKTTVAAVLEQRPGWARPDGPPSFDGGARTTPPRQVSMLEVLQGRRRA